MSISLCLVANKLTDELLVVDSRDAESPDHYKVIGLCLHSCTEVTKAFEAYIAKGIQLYI